MRPQYITGVHACMHACTHTPAALPCALCSATPLPCALFLTLPWALHSAPPSALPCAPPCPLLLPCPVLALFPASVPCPCALPLCPASESCPPPHLIASVPLPPSPPPALCVPVLRFSRLTGDIQALSSADVKLLALAHTLEVVAHGDRHLRLQPVQVRWGQGLAGATVGEAVDDDGAWMMTG